MDDDDDLERRGVFAPGDTVVLYCATETVLMDLLVVDELGLSGVVKGRVSDVGMAEKEIDAALVVFESFDWKTQRRLLFADFGVKSLLWWGSRATDEVEKVYRGIRREELIVVPEVRCVYSWNVVEKMESAGDIFMKGYAEEGIGELEALLEREDKG